MGERRTKEKAPTRRIIKGGCVVKGFPPDEALANEEMFKQFLKGDDEVINLRCSKCEKTLLDNTAVVIMNCSDGVKHTVHETCFTKRCPICKIDIIEFFTYTFDPTKNTYTTLNVKNIRDLLDFQILITRLMIYYFKQIRIIALMESQMDPMRTPSGANAEEYKLAWIRYVKWALYCQYEHITYLFNIITDEVTFRSGDDRIIKYYGTFRLNGTTTSDMCSKHKAVSNSYLTSTETLRNEELNNLTKLHLTGFKQIADFIDCANPSGGGKKKCVPLKVRERLTKRTLVKDSPHLLRGGTTEKIFDFQILLTTLLHYYFRQLKILMLYYYSDNISFDEKPIIGELNTAFNKQYVHVLFDLFNATLTETFILDEATKQSMFDKYKETLRQSESVPSLINKITDMNVHKMLKGMTDDQTIEFVKISKFLHGDDTRGGKKTRKRHVKGGGVVMTLPLKPIFTAGEFEDFLTEDHPNLNCAICTLTLINKTSVSIHTPIIATNNGKTHAHAYHTVCAKKWFENNNTCPECRTIINEIQTFTFSETLGYTRDVEKVRPVTQTQIDWEPTEQAPTPTEHEQIFQTGIIDSLTSLRVDCVKLNTSVSELCQHSNYSREIWTKCGTCMSTLFRALINARDFDYQGVLSNCEQVNNLFTESQELANIERRHKILYSPADRPKLTSVVFSLTRQQSTLSDIIYRLRERARLQVGGKKRKPKPKPKKKKA